MYRAHFGLRLKPFELTPDPRFLYLSSVHQEALAALKYGIWQRRGLIRLVGDVGSGKSTLVRALMEDLDVSVKTVWINHTTIDPTEFLRMVVQDLEIEPKSNDRLDLLTQLQLFLLDEAKAGRPSPVFLIDEAQNLSDQVLEEIRLLSNLETDDRKLAQVVLAGQPELERRLERVDLRNLAQRIAVRAWLSPLSPDETAEYVRHRLKIAGCEDPYLFSSEALRAVWDHTGGLPRLINLLCEQALIYGLGEGKKTIDVGLVNEAAGDVKLSLAGGEEAKQQPAPKPRSGSGASKPVLVPPPRRVIAQEEAVLGYDDELARRQSVAIYLLYALGFVAALFFPWPPDAGYIPQIVGGILALALVVLPFYLRLMSWPFRRRPKPENPWVSGAALIMEDSGPNRGSASS